MTKWAFVACAAAAIVLAVVQPAWAGSTLRLSVVGLAAIIAGYRGDQLRRQLGPRRRSAFTPREVAVVPAELPADLVWLHGLLEDSHGPRRSVHPGVAERLRVVAARRLAGRHRMHIEVPDDHAAIRQIVSPALWLAISPAPPAAPSQLERTDRSGTIPTTSLPFLLDELEHL